MLRGNDPPYRYICGDCIADGGEVYKPSFDKRVEFEVERIKIRDAAREKAEADKQPPDPSNWFRWPDLANYLSGTHKPPEACIGGLRDDDIQVLYPGRWHTVIGLQGSAKTTFALWHAKEIMISGGHVVYLHFEEVDPDGVIGRLLGMGVDAAVIHKRFHWAACDKKWTDGELAYWLTQFAAAPVLGLLDGINAACSQHGWKVGETEAIGSYRAMFVTPLVQTGAAVLSLGHPPKGKDRQNEMHGFGSTAWLDEVDGVGFRMVASKDRPMVSGSKGHSALYVVKDRYSQVKRWGNLDTSKDQPWWYMGAFIVDDTPLRFAADGSPAGTEVRLNVPPAPSSEPTRGKEAILADHIVEALSKRTGRFDSVNQLKIYLAEDGYSYTASHLPIALGMLAEHGQLKWPEVDNARKSRPGWLDLSAGSDEDE
jgi:hypothetical protein